MWVKENVKIGVSEGCRNGKISILYKIRLGSFLSKKKDVLKLFYYQVSITASLVLMFKVSTKAAG